MVIRNEYILQIDSLISQIQDILNKELPEGPFDENIGLTSGMRGEWNINIKRRINYYIEELQQYIVFFKEEDLSTIINYLQNLAINLQEVIQILFESEEHTYQYINEKLNSLKIFLDYSLDLESLDFEYKDYINDTDINKLYNLINDVLPNFDSEEEIFSFIIGGKDLNSKKFISLKLVELYNLQKQQTSPEKARGIEKVLSEIDNYLQLQRPATEVQDLVDQAKSTLDQIQQEKKQINENISIGNNIELIKSYSTEATKLQKTIKCRENIILLLFGIIILLFIFKFYILFSDYHDIKLLGTNYINFFEKPWNLLSFLTLIFSLSALLTYFIKDRSRLIRLHNHFNLKWLELSALPHYMNELTPKQRQELYINLAPNYFKGLYPDKENNTETQNNSVDSLSKALDSILKVAQDNNKK